MTSEIFISYAAPDVARARALHARLVETGFAVWFDRARLAPGCDWHREIEAGCDAARVIVPLLTPHWKRSEWTRYETYASPSVVPVLAEGGLEEVVTPPLRLWQVQPLDPLAAGESEWQALFAALRVKLAEPVPARAPFLLRLPHDANPYFTGREREMNLLHEELHAGPVAALVGRVRAIAALGGMGKTTLANEYVRRFWRLYPQILWVDARLGYEQQFAGIFNQMFPDLANTGLQDADKAQRVRNVLREPAERLLVLDDVADEESATEWIPREGGCRTLITSRFTAFSPSIRTVHLYVLEPEPARAFLFARSGRESSDAETPHCDALARKLDYLPLALEQAGAYVAARRISFTNYLALFDAAAAHLLARKSLGSTHYPDSVITTWQSTTALFSPIARALLRLCSPLAETPIPAAMFEEHAEAVHAYAGVPFPAGDTLGRLAVSEAIVDELACYSMIGNWNGTTFQVHGLVQAVGWLQLVPEDQGALCTEAAGLICAYGPDEAHDPKNFGIWDVVFPHAEAVHRRRPNHPSARPSVVLSTRLAQYSFARARFEDSARYAQERVAMQEAAHGPNSEEVADGLLNYGEPLRELGRRAEAEQAFRRSAAIRRTFAEIRPLNLATSLNYLGMALDDSDEKESVFREGLSICESSGELESLTACKLLHNLAESRNQKGDFDAAEPLYRRSLAGLERLVGWEHPATLIAAAGLGMLLEKRGDYAAAEPLCQRALDGFERMLGMDHLYTLIVSNEQATLLRKLGRAAETQPLLRRVIEATVKQRGVMHPLSVHYCNNLVLGLVMDGKLSEAEREISALWHLNAPTYRNTTPRILFLRMVVASLVGEPTAVFLRQLKTLLCGDPLPIAEHVAHPWDLGYFIDYVRRRLPADTVAFLAAIVAALNDPLKLDELDTFQNWRDQPRGALDAPWPPELGSAPP